MGLYLGDQKVAPIVPVEVPETMYGATLGMVLGTEQVGDLSFDGVTEVGIYRFYGKFARYSITFKPNSTIVFPDLVNVKQSGLECMFLSASSGTNYHVKISFPKLKTINNSGLKEFCAFTTSVGSDSWLNEIDFSSLEVVENYGLQSAFKYQKNLVTVSVPLLKTLKSSSFQETLRGCKSLTKISFPSLTTVQTNSFGSFSSEFTFNGCTALTEIHFRADAQATIEAMSGYSDKWGATSSTIYFDL